MLSPKQPVIGCGGPPRILARRGALRGHTPALSMQIRTEQSRRPTRRASSPGAQLTEAGREVAAARNASSTKCATLATSRAEPRTAFGAVRFAHPDHRAYVLPALLPLLRESQRHWCSRCARRTPSNLSRPSRGRGPAVLALPSIMRDRDAASARIVSAGDPPERILRGGSRNSDYSSSRLLLLEEGHCLRDQALAICNLRQVDSVDTFGASTSRRSCKWLQTAWG